MAFDDKIYLAFSSGNDGTGVVNNPLLPFKTFDGSAKVLVEASATDQYEVIFTESTTEACNVLSPEKTLKNDWFKLTFLNGVIADGDNTAPFFRINESRRDIIFNALDIKNYTYIVERYNSPLPTGYEDFTYINCMAADGVQFSLNNRCGMSNSYLKNVSFTYLDTPYENLTINGAPTTHLNDREVYGDTLLYLRSVSHYMNNLFFKDRYVRFGGAGEKAAMGLVRLNNCKVKFCNSIDNAAVDYELVTSTAELEAKYLADMGATIPQIWLDNFVFDSATETKGFLDSENAYVDGEAVGYGRYGLTYDAITNTIANSDFIIDSGKIKRNVATDATLVFNIDLVKAVRLRRVFLHYDYLGGAEFPNNVLEGGAVKFSIETSLDGISYNSPFDYYGGVDINADLNLFDNVVAKSLRVSITISGADVGELLIESLSVEYQDYPSLEDYNCKQLGDDNGWYLLRETSIGIWESAYKIDINPTGNQEVQSIFDAATGFTQVSKLTAQQLMDALSTSTDLQGLFLEDRGEVVGVDDEETNITIITVNTATPIPIYTLKKL